MITKAIDMKFKQILHPSYMLDISYKKTTTVQYSATMAITNTVRKKTELLQYREWNEFLQMEYLIHIL